MSQLTEEQKFYVLQIFEADGRKWFTGQQNGVNVIFDTATDYCGLDNIFTSKKAAQKAIDILTANFP